MARSAALAARRVAPGILAALDPEETRICDVVGLHRTHIGSGELEVGAQCVARQRALLCRRSRRAKRCSGSQRDPPARHQATLTWARAWPRAPPSSTHSKSSVPESCAVTKKRRYGLAAMPELMRAANTGAPL